MYICLHSTVFKGNYAILYICLFAFAVFRNFSDTNIMKNTFTFPLLSFTIYKSY